MSTVRLVNLESWDGRWNHWSNVEKKEGLVGFERPLNPASSLSRCQIRRSGWFVPSAVAQESHTPASSLCGSASNQALSHSGGAPDGRPDSGPDSARQCPGVAAPAPRRGRPLLRDDPRVPLLRSVPGLHIIFPCQSVGLAEPFHPLLRLLAPCKALPLPFFCCHFGPAMSQLL